jgi:two-component system OmpR family response regulator
LRALIIEDESAVADDLARALQAAGFLVDLVQNGDDAWYRGSTEDYDVAVLDLGLPRLDGLSVLRRWRADNRHFPVIIVSARNDWTEKVAGIEAGADDYLGKPFEVVELVARVRGLVRRAGGRVSSSIRMGDLVLDTHRMSASYAGRPIRLSQLEFRFLHYVAHQGGRAVSAGELGDTNAIEALVVRLRRKIAPEVIETRRGFGYRIAGDSQ